MAKNSRYDKLIAEIFNRHYKKNLQSFIFDRSEIIEIANEIEIELPKNLGDIIYSFRYRKPLPPEITKTTPSDMEWTIKPAGRGIYEFKLGTTNRILPRTDLIQIKVPDSTPELVIGYSLSDEQALLAKIRYNRLIDIFLGITTYSLQSHLRTTVRDIGQIEIDELYIGVSRTGAHYIIPVQAKGTLDQLSVIQTEQDISCCKDKFSQLICRPVSVQFLGNDTIVMFELTMEKEEIRIVDERHYKLVPIDQIETSELENYKNRGL